MTSYKMIAHDCTEKKSAKMSIGVWGVYQCIPLNGSCVKDEFQLWVNSSKDIADEHGVSINFCPFCAYQPERLSEKTSKEDAIV